MRRLRATVMASCVLCLLVGATVGAAAQTAEADPMAPALATGTEELPVGMSEGTTTSAGDTTLIRGITLTGTWEASDPRLSGEVTYVGNYDRSESAGFEVEASSRVVVNGDGRWIGTGTALSTAPGTTPRHTPRPSS